MSNFRRELQFALLLLVSCYCICNASGSKEVEIKGKKLSHHHNLGKALKMTKTKNLKYRNYQYALVDRSTLQ